MFWKGLFWNKFSRALNIAILDLEHAILSFFLLFRRLREGARGEGEGEGNRGGGICASAKVD